MFASPPGYSLIQVATQQMSETDLIVTLKTPDEKNINSPLRNILHANDNDGYNSSPSSSPISSSDGLLTSDSSDWDSISDADTVYLPRFHKKQNPQLSIIVHSDQNDVKMAEEEEREDNNPETNNIYQYDTLFYPHSHLQSLLFSNVYPYVANDYKKIENNHNNEEKEEHTNIEHTQSMMHWNDMQSVNKFKELISQLLMTASPQNGIREDEIYLMFKTPSPFEIIQHLRFGVLSCLCDIHIDRFGRRHYYYPHNADDENNEKSYFYNDSHVPTPINNLVDTDWSHLELFIDDTCTPITPSSCKGGGGGGGGGGGNDIEYYSPSSFLSIDHSRCVNQFNPIRESITSPASVMAQLSPFVPNLNPNLLSNPLSTRLSQHLPDPSTNRLSNYLSTHSNHLATHSTNYFSNQSSTQSSNNSSSNPFANIDYHIRPKKHKWKPNINKIRPKHKFDVPSLPKPQISDKVKLKLQQKKKRKKRQYIDKIMNVDKFQSLSLMDLMENDESLIYNVDNYQIAKKIANVFDLKFGDTDTVVMVSGADKEPDLSYWINGDYIRKDHNVGIYNKTICIYRACCHSQPKHPIVSQQEFEKYVKAISSGCKNKSVQHIGKILDKKFGDGVHFARSTLRRCDYDIFCRFSNKYECSFKLSSGAYIIAWRR